MKKKLLILVIGFAILGCNNDDEGNSGDALIGDWNMISFECCLFLPEVFDTGDIVWKFNTDGTMEVAINIQLNESSQVPLEDGESYPYSVNGETVSVGGVTYDFSFPEGGLTLTDDPEADGSRIQFTSN